MNLLDRSGANTKLAKTNDGSEYLVAGLSMYPDDVLCAFRKRAECDKTCIVFSGMARVFPKVNEARQRKSAWFHEDRPAFLTQLRKELRLHERACIKKGVKPAVRLNVFTDVQWEKFGIPQEFPDIFFYDYTKVVSRLHKLPPNYKLMFSYSGAKAFRPFLLKAWTQDIPISVVFKNKLPRFFMGRRVIDGDKSDLDNVAAGQVIVGLIEKVTGNEASPSFVVDPDLITSIK